MSYADLAKPSSAIAPPLGGGAIGVAGTKFYLRVTDIGAGYQAPAEDVTADGDDEPVYASGEYLHGRHSLRGAMIWNHALGIEQMAGTGDPVEVVLAFTDQHKHTVTCLVVAAQVNWRRGAKVLGVALTLQMTGTAASGIEAPDES